ncbi:hypothetical protein UFOVP112_182 [uncultured Caudovirales phage]|uniref:Uncharacterized protein n=1 Tax=uncultured Caudovirales phage TaxID=2100421 RepID=A0A6J5L3I4_9CAUD|nr:hypothetical protein UFOVP112_182 [uncultured Caudovirales phage]
MRITAVDESRRIFLIEDIFSTSTVNKILSLDWPNLPWKRGNAQEKWQRRQIDCTVDSSLQQAVNEIWNLTEEIGKLCDVTFDNPHPATWWWHDEPGFDVSIHTDGHLPSTMQIFWIAPSEYYATTFYKFKDENTPITEFKFIPNTGYIMLNMPNKDGSQPLQWHGMLNTVPKNSFRVTSYTTFGPYKYK